MGFFSKIATIIASVICVFVLISCRNYGSRADQKIDAFLNDISPLAQQIVPKELKEGAMIWYPAGMSYIGYCGLVKREVLSREEIKKIAQQFKDRAIQSLDIRDTCNVYVGKKIFCSDCNTGHFPIPDFSTSELTKEYVLSQHSVYYVFEASEGDFVGPKNLESSWNPIGCWKNGLTSGAVVDNDQNIIVYWFYIW